MVPRLRAVVVGPGYIGPVHIDALRRNGVEVTALVGSGSLRGHEAAEALGIPAFATLTDALASGPADCVHIATPNYLHAPLALEAIEAGKHVVCEKPLAMTAAEGEELLRAAEDAGVVHGVNFNFRFYAMPRQARSMIRDGGIGPVRLIHGGYLQDWLLREDDWNWRLDPGLGGSLRAVADIGSHWMDLMGFVTGQHPVAVCADMATTVPVRQRPVLAAATFGGQTGAAGAREPIDIHTEDYASVLVRFSGGAHGVFTVSQVSGGRKNSLRFEIDGADSAISWDSERGEELWLGRRGAPSGVMPRDLALLDTEARSVTSAPPGHAEGYVETHRALFAAVYRAIAAGTPPAQPDYPTFADGLRSLRLCEAVARSAAEGRWIETGAGE